MFRKLYCLILATIFTSCLSITNNNRCKRELSTNEMYEILSHSLKNEDLEIIDLDCNRRSISQNKLNEIGRDSLQSEYWMGDNNIIYKLNCTGTPTLDQRILETLVLYHRFGYIPDRNLEEVKIEVDCNNLKETYDDLVNIDQKIRNNPEILNSEFASIDNQKSLKFIKILGKCGIQIEHIDQIWLLNHHSPIDIQMRNYLSLKMINESGYLPNKKLAYSQDRILMLWGFKQEYGSQISPIFKEENVNERRKRVGLGPIEEYIKLFQKNE